MFVDEVTLKVIAGKGGDGCMSFRREKCVPMGGPDGANGGKGADIIFSVDPGLKTLLDLKYQKIIKGQKGENGKGSNRTGKKAEDVIIKVPEGTVVYDTLTNLVIADLVKPGDSAIIVHGGRGGRGNKSFASQNNTAPKISEFGEPGEERIIKCELRMIADVGFIGMPSVGKSTLLSMISSSKPKIAEYHFTTLTPNLGVVKLKDYRTFIVADLPGLIENASNGAGLGLKFLKHAMRTRILAHIIDMGSSEGRDPIQDFKIIRNEINNYSEKLARKKEIVIANKMDLPEAENNLKKFKKAFPDLKVFPVSAINNEGISELLNEVANMIDEIDSDNAIDNDEMESHVLYKFTNEKPYTIHNDNGVWKIEGKEIERIFKMTKFTEDESVIRFGRILKKMGIEDELEKMGAVRGDEVQILDYLFIFKE